MSTKIHKCELCEYGSNRTTDLKRHKMGNHGVKKIKIDIKKQHLEEVKCMQCFAKFKAKAHLNRHIKSIHTDIIVKCEQCNFTSNRKDNVRRHFNRKHGNTSENKFKCEHCSITTSRKHDMKRHFKRKHGNTNFICNKCTFTTNTQDNLTQHIKKNHTLKECGKCLFTSYEMGEIKRHQALHESDDIGVESASEDTYQNLDLFKEDPLNKI